MFRSYFISAIVFCLGYFFCWAAHAQSVSDESFAPTDILLYARFIEHLSNQLDTSVSEANGLCVFGKDEVAEALLGRDKKALAVNISLSPQNKIYSKCKLVYFARNQANHHRAFDPDVQILNKAGIATVSLVDNFDKNGGTFYIRAGRRNFEIFANYRALKRLRVKPTPTLFEVFTNKQDR